MENTKKHLTLGSYATYHGEVKSIDGKDVPYGLGVCRYADHEEWGWFKDGVLSGVAYINFHDFMRVGMMHDGKMNGWGLMVDRGKLEFGYYRNTELVFELTPLVEPIWKDIIKSAASCREAIIKILDYGVIFVGVPLGCATHFSFRGRLGFHFLGNGEVYFGVCDYGHDERTGKFIRFDLDKDITIGEFVSDLLVREIDGDEFIGACDVEDKQSCEDFERKVVYYYEMLSVFKKRTNIFNQ